MDIDIADIVEKMTDAYNEAILNGIEANTIVINEKYAMTDRLYYRGSDRVTFEIPPMFIGLKVAFAELPEAFAFILMNSPIKGEDDIRAEERKRTANEVLDKVYKAVEQARLDCEFQNEKGEWLMDESEFLAEFTLGALHEIYAEYGIDPLKQKENSEDNDD